MLNVDSQAPKLYSFMSQYLSVDSVEEIKQHKESAEVSVAKTLLRFGKPLWKPIGSME